MSEQCRIYAFFPRPADLQDFVVGGIRVYPMLQALMQVEYNAWETLPWESHGIYQTFVPPEYVRWSGTSKRGVLLQPSRGWRLVTLDEERIDMLEDSMSPKGAYGASLPDSSV